MHLTYSNTFYVHLTHNFLNNEARQLTIFLTDAMGCESSHVIVGLKTIHCTNRFLEHTVKMKSHTNCSVNPFF